MTELVAIEVSVPVSSFRIPRAREYFETFPCPPPSTVYGMLLSMVGEVDRGRHEGAEIAIALLSEPESSVTLRKMWRVKDRHEGVGLGVNRRPDYQELLTGLNLAVWIREGKDCSDKPLVSRVYEALKDPTTINRFGGVSLGESSHLVNDVSFFDSIGTMGRLLVADETGPLSLPIWPDHVGFSTKWGQFSLKDTKLPVILYPEAWTLIERLS